MGPWGLAAAGLGLAAYSLLAWGLMAWAPDRAWTVLALFGPVLAVLTAAGLKQRHAPTLAGCVALALLLVVVWRRGGVDINRLYVLQHAVMHLLLAGTFAVTLRPGHKALITAMAETVHPEALPHGVQVYTRQLTVAWMLFFLGMIGLSLLIYATLPWTWWSFFCTVLTPAAAGAAFVGEYAYRRWAHPEFERVSMQRAVQAWRTRSSRAGGTNSATGGAA
jgi:uncharacterized membrane protein